MPSSATTSLRLQKMATGEKLNTWGTELNDSVFEMIEDAIAGWEDHTITGDKTLTSTNYATDEARMAMLNLTGTPGSAFTITIPSVSKWYWIRNATDAAATISAGGTTVTVPINEVRAVLCDGTDCYRATQSDVTDYYLGPQSSDPSTDLDGNALAEGDLYFDTTNNKMKVYDGSSWEAWMDQDLQTTASPTFAGLTLTIPLAVAQGGTGAATAAAARTNLGLGSIATQAASSVAITGGAIDGTAIGGTTPAAGDFTTLTASGDFQATGGSSGSVVINDEDSSLCPTMIFTRNGGGTSTNDFIKFVNSGGEAAAINAIGGAYFSSDVGIGTSSPDGTLHVHSGSAGSVTANSTADNLIVEASGSVGVSLLTANTSQARILFGDPDDNDVGYLLYNHSIDSLAFGVAGNEAMRIDSSGNVGIGTTSPSYPLHLQKYSNNYGILVETGASFTASLNSAATGLVVKGDNSGYAGITIATPNSGNETGVICFADEASGTAGQINYDHANDSMEFHTDDAVKLKILSGGNVGIGTTSPTELLDVDSDAIRVRTSQTPASASATGNAGTICWDADYIYVCTATDTWKRASLATW